MSNLNVVLFNVSIGGYWLKNHNGELTYLGGEARTIECDAHEILAKLETELSGSLYGHKVWYKLPYEYCKDRKVLCDGSDSFQKMCEAAIWTKVVKLFVVNLAEHVDDVLSYEDGEGEARYERTAEFIEENEDFDYHDTPPNSDEENEDSRNFVRCKRGSGVLKLRQVFDSLEEFKEPLVDYAFKERWNIELDVGEAPSQQTQT